MLYMHCFTLIGHGVHDAGESLRRARSANGVSPETSHYSYYFRQHFGVLFHASARYIIDIYRAMRAHARHFFQLACFDADAEDAAVLRLFIIDDDEQSTIDGARCRKLRC